MRLIQTLGSLALAFALVTGMAASVAAQETKAQQPELEKRGEQPSQKGAQRIAEAVRHEILMLPYYSGYDNIDAKVEGGTVILSGDVNWPTTKSSLEKQVRKIEGVEKVVNNINVLPPSSQDNRLRRQVAIAIFGYGGLGRYGWGPHPDIRIIVNSGHVKLEGVVASEADKNVAEIRAKSVSGIFDVQNNLRVEKSE